MRIVILLGPPGSGKGTLAQKCVSDGFLTIGGGDLLRERAQNNDPFGLELRNILNNGKMVENNIILQIVCDKLNQLKGLNNSKGVLLDGVPRNLGQMELLYQYLSKEWAKDEWQLLVFAINADDQLMRDRIGGRYICVNKECGKVNSKTLICVSCGSAVEKRKDDLSDDAVSLRLSIYHQAIKPLKEFFDKNNIAICNFNLTGSTKPEEVFQAFNGFFLLQGSK